MRAATIRDGALSVEEHPDPAPGAGQVLVAVKAAGLNGADMLQRKGGYPAPPGEPQDIPGLELAGEVVGLGHGARRFSEGDRVMAIVGGGGQAELAVLHERAAMPVPEALDWPRAGGASEVFVTAHDALFSQAGLRPGERLLVHGGAGGVGTAAVQLGRATGADVTATVRNEALRSRVEELGATAIDPEGFGDHGPFDVVLELVGAPNLADNLGALATGGRIVVIGVGGGFKAELNLLAVMGKRATVRGSTLRARPLEEKAAAMRAVEREVLPLFDRGEIDVPVAETFPLDQAEAAYDRFTEGGKLGKIVLTITRVEAMRAMVLHAPHTPLRAAELPVPEPGEGEVLIEVAACGVCRTDLHVVDGELTEPKLPLVPGHQIVGRVAAAGRRFAAGDRVGVPWLGWTCGECRYCRSGRENLCDEARFTGYHRDGGFAETAVADERFCFPVPEGYPDLQAAPLLCAGLIGYRTLRLAGDAERVGIYGFGAAAHIVCQVAVHEGRRVFAFTREGDAEARAFALELGAEWAGGSSAPGPEELDAALIFAPAGELVPAALRAVGKGGTVVCGGIHMTDIPSFPYELLWGERVLRTVANLTRADGEEFMALAPRVPVRTKVEPLPLERANEALDRLRAGKLTGALALVP